MTLLNLTAHHYRDSSDSVLQPDIADFILVMIKNTVCILHISIELICVFDIVEPHSYMCLCYADVNTLFSLPFESHQWCLYIHAKVIFLFGQHDAITALMHRIKACV